VYYKNINKNKQLHKISFHAMSDNTRPTRICFVAPNLYPVLSGARDIPVIGGAEFRQATLARAFAAAGYEVSIVTQDFGQPADASIDGVRIFKTHAPRAGIPVVRYLHPRLSSVMRALRAAKADVYYQSSASHLTAAVAWHCRKAGARSIYGGASDTDFMRGDERLNYARDRWLFRWGLEHVDVIVAQTERQASLVQQHYHRAARIIASPYGLPARRRKQCSDLILWVGGIRPVKRPERFIALARSLPQYRFRMIGGAVGGDAEAHAYFESIRSQAAAVSNLAFLGFQPLDEVELHFDEARVFVNTSEHEGFPNTFLQAWARGIPTVSYFDAGANQDGSRPFAYVPDETAAMASLANLIADDAAWRALSECCSTHFAARHSTAKTLDAYADLFRDMRDLGAPATGTAK
jgi:glycosyltransferase involved in cell wall biosynthesis